MSKPMEAIGGIIIPGFYPNKGSIRPVHINDLVNTGQLRDASFDLTRTQADIAEQCVKVIDEAESTLGSNLSSSILNRVISSDRISKKLTHAWLSREITLNHLLTNALQSPKEIDLTEAEDVAVVPIDQSSSALDAVKNYWFLYGACAEYLLSEEAFQRMGTLQLSLTTRFMSRTMRNALYEGIYADIK